MPIIFLNFSVTKPTSRLFRIDFTDLNRSVGIFAMYGLVIKSDGHNPVLTRWKSDILEYLILHV